MNIRKIDKSNLTIQWWELGRGVRQYIAYEKDWIGPVGMAWVLGFGGNKQGDFGTALVLDSYVPKWCRRMGVRTYINGQILKHFSRVVSSPVTKEGTAFMRNAGYKRIKETGDWVLQRKT